MYRESKLFAPKTTNHTTESASSEKGGNLLLHLLLLSREKKKYLSSWLMMLLLYYFELFLLVTRLSRFWRNGQGRQQNAPAGQNAERIQSTSLRGGIETHVKYERRLYIPGRKKETKEKEKKKKKENMLRVKKRLNAPTWLSRSLYLHIKISNAHVSSASSRVCVL
jgi:hypothetical protein